MLFVFDTNALVSAMLKPVSLPAKAVECATQKGKLIFSEETENEYLNVIAREKFNTYLPMAQRLKSATQLVVQSEKKEVSILFTDVCRDVADIKFLNLAFEWKVDCIVSGDWHLKELHPFRGVPILSPADFLKRF